MAGIKHSKSQKDVHIVTAAQDREMTKKYILKNYPEVVKANKKRLCKVCKRWEVKECKHKLLPCTVHGEDCPYFEKGEKENEVD